MHQIAIYTKIMQFFKNGKLRGNLRHHIILEGVTDQYDFTS